MSQATTASSSPAAPPAAPSRGWTVVFAGVGINLILGTLYAWGVMGKALVGQLKWNKTDAALPFAASTAAFAIMMIFAGRMQDKLGPRIAAILGGIMFGAGLALSSLVSSPLMMSLTFGVIGGIGIGLGYSATTPAAIKWFPAKRKGLITGIVVSGVGLAAVYMGPLTQYLLGVTTIANTFLVLGIGAIVVICTLALLLGNPPPGYAPAAPALAGTAPAPRPAPAGSDWHEMLATPQFYLLWLMYVLAAAAGLMVISNVAIIAKEQAGWEAGFVPVMMLAAFNTAARIVGGYVSDRIGRTNTMVLFFILQAGNMFCFSFYTTPALLIFGACFTGLCYGTIFTLMPAATADFYGLKNMGVNYGLVFTGFGVAGVLGSLVGGRVRDLLGSYSVAYTVMGFMLVLAAVLALVTKAPRIDAQPPGK